MVEETKTESIIINFCHYDVYENFELSITYENNTLICILDGITNKYLNRNLNDISTTIMNLDFEKLEMQENACGLFDGSVEISNNNSNDFYFEFSNKETFKAIMKCIGEYLNDDIFIETSINIADTEVDV